MPKKGVYIWQANRQGSPESVVEELKHGNIEFVAIKTHNGTYYWSEVEPYVKAIRNAGIEVGGWGYVYLINPIKEAAVAARSARDLGLSFYLIDAETEAKRRPKEAARFSYVLKNSIGGIPVGLTSYRFPNLHREFPWKEFRDHCQFDAPQVYWRQGSPEYNLDASYAQFKQLKPELPYKMPAGDMFWERGIKPSPDEIVQFLNAVEKYPEITHLLMWSFDQRFVVPELWEAYTGSKGHLPPVGEVLFSAVSTGSLNIRAKPYKGSSIVGGLRNGSRVDVYEISGNWAAINEDRTHWVYKSYLKEI